MREYSKSEVLEELRHRLKTCTQKELSESLGFHPSFLNDVLHGRRDLTDKFLKALGFERQEYFTKIKDEY